MKKLPLRITATLLLVIALLTLSGITATASTMLGAAAHHSSCCDSDDSAPTAPTPCSSPDCGCFSCVTMIVYPPLRPQRGGEAGLLPVAAPKRHPLSAFVPSIDYPPEQA